MTMLTSARSTHGGLPTQAWFAAIFVVALAASLPDAAAQAKLPKYGPGAVRLADDHEYVRRHAAPDFWVLTPYYLPQHDEQSCSVASLAMLVNAARAGRTLTADEPLATARGLLERMADESWRKAVAAGGQGVSLDALGQLAGKSLRAYGVVVREIVVVRMAGEARENRDRLLETLRQNERASNDLVLVNFRQDLLTGDPEGRVGHIAPLAAYDDERQRVLVFDPDRRWYEPYWVSVDQLLAAMAATDPETHQPRGYVWVKW